MFVEILKDDKDWTTFLNAIPNASFYHTLKWRDVVQRTFSCTPLYLTIRDELEKVVGVCPGFIKSSMHFKTYDSIAYSDYGGPLILDHFGRQGMLLLRDFLQKFCLNTGIDLAKFCILEESGLSGFCKLPSAYVERTRGVMEIDLKTTSSDFLWNEFYSGRDRKRLRRFERVGFQIQEAQTKSDLLEFYNLYTKSMRDIGGSPDPYRLIENMWNILYPANLRLWILRNDKIVGAELFLQTESASYARYSAVDREQAGTRFTPFDYISWTEIKRACQEGKRCVSLGSTSSDPYNPHHIQKKEVGASFHRQDMIWCPFTSIGYSLIRARSKAVPIWRATRAFLPVVLKSFLEDAFLRV
jgi:hypothetical protein